MFRRTKKTNPRGVEMKKKNPCDLCNKERGAYDEFVWYAEWTQTDLCRSCMGKWTKSKERKVLEEKYKDAKPTTKLWHKKCKELQKAFDKWFEEKEKK